MENFKGVLQFILETQHSNLEKPYLGSSADWWRCAAENVDAISKEGRTWTQSGNHAKQAELAGVKNCSRREAASKEVHCRGRSFWVKSEEALQGDLVVMV